MAQLWCYEWPVLGSTHDWAAAWVQKTFVPHGRWVWVRAYTQTQGRGRLDRKFYSPLGGLYVTLVCPWPTKIVPPLLSLVVALSVTDALSIEPLRVKWVNDLYIHHQKLGGVLVEPVILGQNTLLLMSLGLNVNTVFPSGSPFTSLSQAWGCSLDINFLWHKISICLYQRLLSLVQLDLASLVTDLNARLRYRDEEVYVKTVKGWFKGIFCGVDEEGKVCLDDGKSYAALSVGTEMADMA